MSRGDPLVELRLEEGLIGPPGFAQLWRLAGEVPLPEGPFAYDQRLTRHEDGTLTLHADGGGLRIDATGGVLTIEAARESLARQLLTTFGLPLVLHGAPSLVLHACAAVPPSGSGAVVVSGTSGSGKSTLLVGLIERGWRAVSEDLCVVDLRERTMVWPGPPWVRRVGEGPAGSRARFRTPEKTAWDIAPWQVDEAVPVERLVFLEPPGSDEVIFRPMEHRETVSALGGLSVWLAEQSNRAAATFGPAVRLAGTLQVTKLRVPMRQDWLDVAEPLLRIDG